MKKLFALFSFLLLPPSIAHTLTLNEVITKTLSSSPQLNAQRHLVNLSGFDKIRRFIPNEPEFQITDNDSHTSQSYGANLNVGFPGKAFVMHQMDVAKEKAQKNELLAKQFDLTLIAAQNYIDCSASRLNLEVMQRNLSDLNTLRQIIQNKYETGSATQAEFISLMLQEKQQELDLDALKDKTEVSCKKLEIFLGNRLPENNVLQLPDDLDETLLTQLTSKSSDEARAEGNIEVSKAVQKLAYWNFAPDLNLGYARYHYFDPSKSPNGQEWNHYFSLGIQIPLFSYFHERADAQKEKYQAVIDESNARLQQLSARTDIENAARDYQRSIHRLDRLRLKDLPLAEALIQSTLTSYQSGKLGFAEVILARKTLNELRTQDIQLRSTILLSHLKCLNQCTLAESNSGKSL